MADKTLLEALEDLRDADTLYFARLTGLNDSGARGTTLIGVSDGEATAVTFARGVEAGQSHPMHIHGFGGFPDADTPTLDEDTDGDGFIEVAEGAQAYGPIQVDISPGVTGARFIEIQHFDFNDDTANGDLTPDNLDNHEVVLHGLTLEDGEGANGGEADGTAGYKEILPIAAGELINLTKFREAVENFEDGDAFYATSFTALNGSGVAGGAVIAVNDGEATVIAFARGVEEGQSHPLHIHGFGGTPDAELPTLANDADGDGFIEVAEGAQAYGPVQVDISAGVTAGNFIHIESFDFDDDIANGDLTPDNLDSHEVVLHGLTLDDGQGANGGEADGTPGYKEILPIAAGELSEVGADGARALAALLIRAELQDDLMVG